MKMPRPEEDIELAPPPELARLRAILARPPAAATRARHLAAAMSSMGDASTARRFASRGVRVAVAVVATLAVTTGLAAAQVLPTPAQKLFGSVSDRFAPPTTEQPIDTADPGGAGGGAVTTVDDADDGPGDPQDDSAVPPPTSDDAPTARAGTTATTSAPPPEDTTVPTVTVPGPGGPGSPDDPTGPEGTDGGSGEPTDPSTTTTSTTVPGGDGGTTDAGPAEATTTTTAGAGGGGTA